MSGDEAIVIFIEKILRTEWTAHTAFGKLKLSFFFILLCSGVKRKLYRVVAKKVSFSVFKIILTVWREKNYIGKHRQSVIYGLVLKIFGHCQNTVGVTCAM